MKMAWLHLPTPSHPGQQPWPACPTALLLPPPRGACPSLEQRAGRGAGGVLAGAVEAWEAVAGGAQICSCPGREVPWHSGLGALAAGRGGELFCFPVETVWTGQGAGRCGFSFIVHLQGDGGVKAAPSGAVLVDLESGIGRGTGLATGGGGGSKNDPGTLPWPLPLGCEQHK